MLRRSWLLVTLALGLLAAPLPAQAEQAGKVYRIGWLDSSGSSPTAVLGASFLRGLRDRGWVAFENFVLEYRSARGKFERLPDLAAELVRLKVDVILAPKTPEALAAKKATRTIPIVFVGLADPVGSGLVASLARPGGNVTGLSSMLPELSGKQLELLKEIVPGLSRVAVLWDATHSGYAQLLKQTQVAAEALGVTLQSFGVQNPDDVETAFAAMTRERPEGLMVLTGGMESPYGRVMGRYREQIADFALEYQLPTTSNLVYLTNIGGLISYSPRFPETYERAAYYVDRILKGANPADLPVEQPREFELVLNLKTAKALGITFPDSVLIRATKLIE